MTELDESGELGRPNGVMNGGVKLEKPEGNVTSPKVRITVEFWTFEPDAVVTKGLAGKMKEDGSRPPASGREYTSKKDNDVEQPDVASMATKEGLKQEKLNNPSQMVSESLLLCSLLINFQEWGDVDTKPRTQPPANAGSQWKGVPLEGGYQTKSARNEGRKSTPGEARRSTESGIRAGAPQREVDEDPVTKPNMNKVYSSTATTGHDEDIPEKPAVIAQSKFTQPSPSQIKGTPVQTHGNTVEQPHQAEPPERPHDSSVAAVDMQRATNGKGSSHVQGEQGRKRGGFLNKIKGWSKRLSQDKKGQNMER